MKKPATIRIGGQVYRALTMLVEEEDAAHRPRRLRVLGDDETVTLKGGEKLKFLIVYVVDAVLRGRLPS